MERPLALLALGLSLLASCSGGAPAKTSSGELIDSVSYEERLAPSPDLHEVTLKGERLAKAIELMDRAQVTGLSGSFQSADSANKSVLVLTINGLTRRQILIKDCAEPRVCAFFAAAVKSEIVKEAPAVCRDGVRCMDE